MTNNINEVKKVIAKTDLVDLAMDGHTLKENRDLLKEIVGFFQSDRDYNVHMYNCNGEVTLLNSGQIGFAINQTIEGKDDNKLEIQLAGTKIQGVSDISPSINHLTGFGYDSQTRAVLLRTKENETIVYVPNGQPSDDACVYFSERE